MKRIISLLMLVFVLLSSVAYAANSYSIYDVVISYDPVDDSIGVSGFVNTSKTELMMVLKVEKDGILVEAQELFATELVNGNLYFKFEDVAFAATAQDGLYNISISSRYTPISAHTYNYKGGNTLFETMRSIQTYTAADNFSELMRVIGENQNLLGIDNSIYTTLNANELILFQDVLLSKTYDLKDASEYGSAAERKEAVQTEVADLISYYEEAMAVVEYGRIATKDELNEWVSEYADNITLNQDSTLYQYFNEVKGTAEFLDHTKSNRAVSNKDTLRKIIYENVMLTLIQTKYYTVSKGIFESYAGYFGLDLTNYNTLTSTTKSQVYSKLQGNFYNTVAKAAEALEDFAKSYVKGDTSGNIKPEWGGGASSSGAGSGTVLPNNVVKPVGLTDLNDAKWAEPAIVHLYKKGIVSGYNNRFEPNSNVTRAQFVKMILLAAGKSVDGTYSNTFSDVSAQDWYAPYVSVAKQLGIIKGDNEGKFNPNSFITRQDMAVMIYRTFSFYDANKECTLTDFDLVSDYAKDAVELLSGQKIINGYADGSFLPFNNATRAEAAQMLYNIIQ